MKKNRKGSGKDFLEKLGEFHRYMREESPLEEFRAWAMMGLDIKELGGNCPVQAGGHILGRPYYFRARHSHWEFRVPYNKNDDPVMVNWPERDTEFTDHKGEVVKLKAGPKGFSYDEEYCTDGCGMCAGWMELEEAVKAIKKGATLFVEHMFQRRDVDENEEGP